MGLAQTIKFEADRKELVRLLTEIGYNAITTSYFRKQTNNVDIEIRIEEDGLYIHRSGKYLEDLGLLIERLGDIATRLVIEDYP